MDISTAFTELTATYKAELTQYSDFLQTSQQLTQVLQSGARQQRLSELLALQSRIILELNILDEKAQGQKERLAQELGLEQLSASSLDGLPGVEQFKWVLQELGVVLKELERVEGENAVLLAEQLNAFHQKTRAPLPTQMVRGAYRKKAAQLDHSIDKKR